jgi:DNA-binding IclR family transcriptional regulator
MSVKHAVLGHLVLHPDYGYRLRAELAEQLEMPDLSKTTVYVTTLAKVGLLELNTETRMYRIPLTGEDESVPRSDATK